MTRTARLRQLLPVALAGLALVVAACGDDAGTGAAGNAVDMAFVEDMVAHHEDAVAMSRLAREHAEHPRLRRLAARIAAAQRREIGTMAHLHEDMDAAGVAHHGDGLGLSHHEMGMDMDLGELEDAEPFDRAFLDLMIAHHEGALAMAQRVRDEGTNPAVGRMAEAILATQRDEIAQMRRWRAAWYGDGHDMTHGA